VPGYAVSTSSSSRHSLAGAYKSSAYQQQPVMMMYAASGTPPLTPVDMANGGAATTGARSMCGHVRLGADHDAAALARHASRRSPARLSERQRTAGVRAARRLW